MLFGAAQDLARQRRLLADGVRACIEASSLERGMFKLRNPRNQLIAAIPVREVRDMLAYRRELARDVMQRAGVQLNDANPTSLERRKVRIQTVEVRALAWAISTGRRVPMPVERKMELLSSVGLLLCCVIPGVIYILRGQQLRRAYTEDLKGLVHRWRMAGKPDPADSFFSLYYL